MFIAIPNEEGTRYINREAIDEYRVDDNTIVIFYMEDESEFIYFKSAEIAEKVAREIALCSDGLYAIAKDDLDEAFN